MTMIASGLYTDLYQLTMAQIYFLNKRHQESAVFDYFFRKLPLQGGYAISAGLGTLLDYIEAMHFTPDDLDYLDTQGFDKDFIHYLSTFTFRGDIHAVTEGEVIFPQEPVLIVEAPIIEAQLLETFILNCMNFQTLITTRARRIQQIAGGRSLFEFGLRRAQGLGGMYATRAAILGGFDGSSNVLAGKNYDIPVTGTMSHAFVQSYTSEREAFEHFAKIWPQRCTLLVDTYNTLTSGLPNAIYIAHKLRTEGYALQGIRIDSGDLAYLAHEARKMLDTAGFPHVRIIVSNQLDEVVIKSLIEQNAPIDGFGVGTQLVTGAPDAALDGVYKLASINNKPCIKVSETFNKTTLPDKKQVFRLLDAQGHFLGADVITRMDESPPPVMYNPFDLNQSRILQGYAVEPILTPVMLAGKRTQTVATLHEIAQWSAERLAQLPQAYKRSSNPHQYKVGLSPALVALRQQLMQPYQTPEAHHENPHSH